jgi:hypothetical protein
MRPSKAREARIVKPAETRRTPSARAATETLIRRRTCDDELATANFLRASPIVEICWIR